MDFSFISEYYNFYIDGTLNTLKIAIFTVLFGSILGLIISLLKLSKNKIIRFIAITYIEFIRGTPLLVQLFLLYYGLNIHFSDFTAAVIALSINSSAYIAEIIRAGILSIDNGQMEAARSLGMNHFQAMVYVIIPQAIRNILPALGNEFVVLVKESAIVSYIGIADLMYKTNQIRGISFRSLEPLLVAAIIYFIITFTISRIIKIFEGRLQKGYGKN